MSRPINDDEINPLSSEAQSAQLVLTMAKVLYSNGQMTDQVIDAAQRLAAALGLNGKLVARWAGLSLLQTPAAHTTLESQVIGSTKAAPTSVNMDRVAAAMRVIADVEAGRLRPAQACVKLNSITTRPPAADWAFALAAATGAVALAVIFGLRHMTAAMLIFACAGTGALLRRKLGRHTGNLFIQPFMAALLAGIVGAVAVRLDFSSSLRLVAVCPCMVLVPGPHLLNAAADTLKGRLKLGWCRLIYAGLIISSIAAGLLLGLTVLGVALPPEPATADVSMWSDMIASGIAVLAFSVFFSTPARMILWPLAIGMGAHLVRWWLLTMNVELATAAFIACVLAGVALTPVSHRYHMPFAAIGFAAVVSLMPGVFLFRTASGLLTLLQGSSDSIGIQEIISNGMISARILFAMSLGLIGPKLVIDRFIVPNRIRYPKRLTGTDQ
jgi:uncharacterized membrane protein YjjP (DUF1212 family)